MYDTKNWNRIKLVTVALAGVAIGALLSPAGSSAQNQKNQVEHDGHDHGDAGGMLTRKSENWAPFDGMHLYLCAFHIAKEKPSFQVEAHHFCSPVGKGTHQCVIYDSKGPGAKLLGVEYIIGNDVYQTLSKDEKKYWHPHAYEILSGQLIAGDMPDQGDGVFPGLIETWGKTWHTWRDPSTDLPLGEPMLMWSANGDGQIGENLVSHRDAQFGIKTAETRERRKAWGYEIPNLPPPKSLKEHGRKWTAKGPDEPKKK